jgi:integrase
MDFASKWHPPRHLKTAFSWRLITLPDFAVTLLRRYIAERTPAKGEPVLPSHAGTFRSPNNFRRHMREALPGTGFEWVTPHTFRRTATQAEGHRACANGRDQGSG